MVDYELLRLIWWAILGILLIGFVVLDGFDMGVAMLLPYLGRTDQDRRIMLNTVGPVWEGNQVWLILGVGASFAAWPMLYALSFSGLYGFMYIILLALILRPVGFTFRSKMPSALWRRIWDSALFISAAIPSFFFGTIFGNVFIGFPYLLMDDLMHVMQGHFWSMEPFTFVCGAISVSLMILQGATYLQLKVTGIMAQRAGNVVSIMALLLLVLITIAGYLLLTKIKGYTITSPLDGHAPSNPLHKTVTRSVGAWVQNFRKEPLMVGVPILAYIALLNTFLFSAWRKVGLAFIMSSLSVITIMATAGLALFPFLMPCSFEPHHSLTVWDASASQMTLFVMLIAVIILFPIVLLYTAWVYRVLRGPVTNKTLEDHKTNAY